MIRIGETKKTGQLLNQMFKKEKILTSKHVIKQMNEMSKDELWKIFTKTFYEMFGKEFQKDEDALKNLKVLFYYFLQDEKFFECENLRADITIPSFKKGLLIIGGCGLGKSDYLSVFEKVFKNCPSLRFKFYTSKELVQKYEMCQTPLDKDYFFRDVMRKRMFIDDINSERIASNYGKIDVIEEVLANRYDKKLTTFASCNYTNSDKCVRQTLVDLGLRYGGRIYDRLYQIFNVVEFGGLSYRR
jgi:DNA replication protein DnaC